MNKLTIGDFPGDTMSLIPAGKAEDGKSSYLVKMQSYDLEKQESRTLILSSQAAEKLIEYANERLNNMSGSAFDAVNEYGEQSELRRPDFIVSLAKEFCTEHRQPFLLESKMDGPFSAQLTSGIESPDGQYRMQSGVGKTPGVLEKIKAFFSGKDPAGLEAKQAVEASARSQNSLLDKAKELAALQAPEANKPSAEQRLDADLAQMDMPAPGM